MNGGWKPRAGGCESDVAFEDLPTEVQRYVREAREWASGEGAWSSVEFVDRPRGRLFSVRRTVDELGLEEITVAEIRYVEHRP